MEDSVPSPVLSGEFWYPPGVGPVYIEVEEVGICAPESNPLYA